MILDSRTLQSTPESGARAAYDGAKRRKGSKVHAAVDTLVHLLALHVTAADQAASQHGIQSIGGCPVADDFGVGCVAVHVVGLQQQFEIRQGTV